MNHSGPTVAGQPERPSLKVLLVPRLLAHGLAPEQVAHITGVPAALVWLIDENRRSEGDVRPTTGTVAAGRVHRGRHRREHLRRLATLAIYAAGCTLTILWHQPIMPLAVAAAALIAARRNA
ncbi:hypothetical protein [Sinomonas sp. G460-2]|uniref:hypothetical protein n=1 Tax=Sinomonas sp. G460-2 TaxID=3393464 RepID=UPI0039EE49F2